MYERNFSATQPYSLVSRVWGNSYDNGTFWTADIAASYGIELYPIHGGSLYLGHNTTYVEKLWNEITQQTGIIGNQVNPNLWHDVYWKYLSFIDPQAAIDLYDAYPDREIKFGVSDAQTYHWLHGMNAMGSVAVSITADHPIAAAFVKDGVVTYVGHNYSNAPITIHFSDGYSLDVPAHQMATSMDASVSGVLSSDFDQAYANGSVTLSVATSGSGVTKVDFYDGATLIGSKTSAPYDLKAENLSLGIHGFYAKVFAGTNFNVTNIIKVQVGEQVSFLNTPIEIPGIIEPGNYDAFEGGVGQNISYVDSSQKNEGDYRLDEYVDSENNTSEGKIVGWFSAGEWMEYSIDVKTSGKYNLDFRYSSGNPSGGGPFYLEIDGLKISPDITVTSTNDWENWASKTVSDLELSSGKHILRLVITSGEFNLGKMNFMYSAPLGYVPPIANAGENVVVILPATTATLDGTLSNDPEGESITYQWTQIYGPSTITFNDSTIASPTISNLEKGIYKCKLEVHDGIYSAFSEVFVLVQETSNSNPTVNLTSPTNNASFSVGTPITLNASASDLDGAIAKVEFFDGNTKLGEDSTSPYSYTWTGASVGIHELKAIATDNNDGVGVSQLVNVSVVEVQSCSETSTEAREGSFTTGYKASFETVGSNVHISFELLDTNRSGVIAYLWKESPFAEVQMDQVSSLKFSKTIGGLQAGETISYACKFAFAGGLAVTKYISYEVGSSCSSLSVEDEVLEHTILMYPNPVGNQLFFKTQSETITRIQIYSLQGRLVKTETTNFGKISVEELSSGLYMVQITTSKGIISKKLMKQ